MSPLLSDCFIVTGMNPLVPFALTTGCGPLFAHSFRARGVEGDEGVHAEEEEVGGGEVEGGGEEDGGEAGGAAGAEAEG